MGTLRTRFSSGLYALSSTVETAFRCNRQDSAAGTDESCVGGKRHRAELRRRTLGSSWADSFFRRWLCHDSLQELQLSSIPPMSYGLRPSFLATFPCVLRVRMGSHTGTAVQEETSNRRLLLDPRDVSLNKLRRGSARPYQVRGVEATVGGSLKTCQAMRMRQEAGDGEQSRDWAERNSLTARSASSSYASRPRSGLSCGTWEPFVPCHGELQARGPQAAEYDQA